MAEYESNNLRSSRINSIIPKKQRASIDDNREKLEVKQMQSSGNIIQQKLIPVGYDSIGDGKSEDVLVTSGLANCIAIVAYDRDKKRAAMGHFNTSQAFTSQGLFNEGVLTNFKHLIDSTWFFRGKIEYHICLGSLWFNCADNSKKMFEMRHNLIGSCINVFGTEPDVCSSTAFFDIKNGRIVGDFDFKNMPKGWERAGKEIKYLNLRK